MKVLLKFSGFNYDKQIVIEWAEQTLKTFPPYSKYDGRFWGAIMFDKDTSGQADQIMIMSEHKEEALPYDMNGNRFPVVDIESMFKLNPGPAKPCWCGVDSYGSGEHSNYCPKGGAPYDPSKTI